MGGMSFPFFRCFYLSSLRSNLYVKNLGEVINDESLKEAFAKFGKITSAKVMMTDGTPSLSKGVPAIS